MSFEADIQRDINRETYKELKRRASDYVSQINTWNGQFNALRASVDAEKQAELDAEKQKFVAGLRSALGI